MDKSLLKHIMIPVAYSLFKNMPLLVGLDQFTQIKVGVKGIKDSNKFLHSFCNQLDILLHPEHTENVAPWIYRPSKHQVHGNVSFRVIGKVQTSIGHFTIGYLTDNSSNIDTLCLHSNNCKEEYEQVFKEDKYFELSEIIVFILTNTLDNEYICSIIKQHLMSGLKNPLIFND